MLNRLVLTNRTAEHDTLAGVVGGLAQRRAAEPNRLGRNQDALGVHALQDVFKAAAFFADAVSGRYRQRINKQLIGVDRASSHLGDFAYIDILSIERRVEKTQAFGSPLDVVDRRSPRQDQHLARNLRGRDPDLLA